MVDDGGSQEPAPDRGLEEKLSFLERELDHLRDQLKDVWKEVGELERRIDRITRASETPGEEPDEQALDR